MPSSLIHLLQPPIHSSLSLALLACMGKARAAPFYPPSPLILNAHLARLILGPMRCCEPRCPVHQLCRLPDRMSHPDSQAKEGTDGHTVQRFRQVGFTPGVFPPFFQEDRVIDSPPPTCCASTLTVAWATNPDLWPPSTPPNRSFPCSSSRDIPGSIETFC